MSDRPSAWARLRISLGYWRGPLWMSALRRRWLLFRNPHVDIRFEGPVYLGPRFSLHAPHGGSFIVGPGVEFRRGFRAELHGPDSRIVIGEACAFTYDVVIQCGETIEIGDRCIFAQGTMVVDGSHRFRDLDRPMVSQGYDFRPVRIHDDAALMSKCTVVGAEIGTRAFVGANSVVSRDIPAYTVAIGAPATPVDYFGPPGEEPPELVASRSSR
jgi:acetyltransferase-like isoleucine patch superfamily enzyme